MRSDSGMGFDGDMCEVSQNGEPNGVYIYGEDCNSCYIFEFGVF